MSNEATIRGYLSIRKTSGVLLTMDYRSPGPSGFNDTVDGSKGPTPGALTIPAGGKVVSLDELVTPGWCVIKNLDPDTPVEYGILSATSGEYLPFGEVPPGITSPPFKFSRNFREGFTNTGTGTSGEVNKLFMKPIGGLVDVNVTVEAFEA